MKLTPINVGYAVRTLVTISLLLGLAWYAQRTIPAKNSSSKLHDFPHTILWAWERPEDLRFLKSEQFAVAFLAQTLTLTTTDVMVKPVNNR